MMWKQKPLTNEIKLLNHFKVFNDRLFESYETVKQKMSTLRGSLTGLIKETHSGNYPIWIRIPSPTICLCKLEQVTYIP